MHLKLWWVVLMSVPLNAQVAPDLILTNGKIWTVDGAHKEAEAVAIRSNRIEVSMTRMCIFSQADRISPVWNCDSPRAKKNSGTPFRCSPGACLPASGSRAETVITKTGRRQRFRRKS